MKELIKSITEALHLMESPEINHYHSKENMSAPADSMRDTIKANTEKHAKLGKDMYSMPDVNGNGTVYFRKNSDGEPQEFSKIDRNNVHFFTSKGNGDSEHIHNFIKHHIDAHGEVFSSTSNTLGSKRLWQDFFDKNKEHYSFENYKAGKKIGEFHGELPKNYWYDSNDHRNFDQDKDRTQQYLRVTKK